MTKQTSQQTGDSKACRRQAFVFKAMNPRGRYSWACAYPDCTSWFSDSDEAVFAAAGYNAAVNATDRQSEISKLSIVRRKQCATY